MSQSELVLENRIKRNRYIYLLAGLPKAKSRTSFASDFKLQNTFRTAGVLTCPNFRMQTRDYGVLYVKSMFSCSQSAELRNLST